jgi:hypothetical protein
MLSFEEQGSLKTVRSGLDKIVLAWIQLLP